MREAGATRNRSENDGGKRTNPTTVKATAVVQTQFTPAISENMLPQLVLEFLVWMSFRSILGHDLGEYLEAAWL